MSVHGALEVLFSSEFVFFFWVLFFFFFFCLFRAAHMACGDSQARG